MKRKILAVALSVLILCAGAAGTAAYYTAAGTAVNVITTGSVQASLREWADEDRTVPFADVENAMPGACCTKIVEVENTGDNAAWIRLRLEKDYELAQTPLSPAEMERELARITLDIDREHWTEQDGWFYYNEPLDPGRTTQPLFTRICFDEKLGNLWQESSIFVNVTMEAVQTANNGTSPMDAAGWPSGGLE